MTQQHTMRAMLLDAPGRALRPARVPLPVAGPEDVLIKVSACGVCRTDLHIADGELAPRGLPRVLGHEIVGTVVRLGSRVRTLVHGQRVGVPWLGGSCGHCSYCNTGRENLCERAVFTGYHRDGGYAEYAAADARYCVALPGIGDDAHAAPLLCAGLIGYRAYALTGSARRIGLYGFGAAAHIIAQLALREGRHVYAFTRPGDARSQRFALELGACWAGPSDAPAPQALDAAIIFAPDGALVPQALGASARGATIVCAGIHMSEIPAFPYALLWGERCVRSVANLTRADAQAFFSLPACSALKTVPVPFRLECANEALAALRSGRIDGAAVLLPGADAPALSP